MNCRNRELESEEVGHHERPPPPPRTARSIANSEIRRRDHTASGLRRRGLGFLLSMSEITVSWETSDTY